MPRKARMPRSAEQGESASARLLANKERIIERWVHALREHVPAASTEHHAILVDTLPALLDQLAEALAPNCPAPATIAGTSIPGEHGGERVRVTQFRLEDVISEYRLLRNVLVQVLEEKEPLTLQERTVLHSSIDQAVAKACTAYALVQESFRQQLFAILAHDLRGPLTAACTDLALIRRKPSSAEIPRLAARAAESLNRVDRMLQDLLDAMRAQAGGRTKLDLDDCDLMDIARKGLAHLEAKHGNCFVLEGPDSLRGHLACNALQRAIENLGSNAVKYGVASQPITIKVREVQGRAVITVHNQGSYIPAEDRETIFRAFNRTRRAEQGSKRGWGLGLAQVRGVVEAHGGSIAVDSYPHSGTTFVIDIPLDARPFQDAPVTS